MYGGTFVGDRHGVRGRKQKFEGETIYAWDPKQKKVTYTYVASDGGFSTSIMHAVQGGLVFSESYEGDGGGLRMRNLWTVTGPDSYDVSSRSGRTAIGEMWRVNMLRSAR